MDFFQGIDPYSRKYVKRFKSFSSKKVYFSETIGLRLQPIYLNVLSQTFSLLFPSFTHYLEANIIKNDWPEVFYYYLFLF